MFDTYYVPNLSRKITLYLARGFGLKRDQWVFCQKLTNNFQLKAFTKIASTNLRYFDILENIFAAICN